MTSAGQLVSRVLIRNGRVGLPLELAGAAPVINPRFTQRESIHAILDTDASYARREVFDLGKVEACLSALHREISKSFKATITEYAEASWA
jgi:uncharacterized protein (TIGR04255 family)